ncbi:helix-turn-helix transcriptional regulator [Novosphingobium sp. 9]|uniref:helix-turn-helix transcriptional regulator n=1 Tax=Novosphingobium sp. 9 TaxID=2025349 RepID=UPI0021B6942C|nr:sigma factor-like helix-turn-helix DNA-binding protein [Novosphingobium sp. 9]
MDNGGQDSRGVQDDATSRIRVLLPELTAKQHEVLRFVAENRTSKEIAWELGISESAVNQRIEGVRSRSGSPPRNELARVYRQYLTEMEEACNPVPDKIPQVNQTPATVVPQWQDEMPGSGLDGRIVPKVLDGPAGRLNRTAAMVMIAMGMLLTAVLGLTVVRALSDLT